MMWFMPSATETTIAPPGKVHGGDVNKLWYIASYWQGCLDAQPQRLNKYGMTERAEFKPPEGHEHVLAAVRNLKVEECVPPWAFASVASGTVDNDGNPRVA